MDAGPLIFPVSDSGPSGKEQEENRHGNRNLLHDFGNSDSGAYHAGSREDGLQTDDCRQRAMVYGAASAHGQRAAGEDCRVEEHIRTEILLPGQ